MFIRAGPGMLEDFSCADIMASPLATVVSRLTGAEMFRLHSKSFEH